MDQNQPYEDTEREREREREHLAIRRKREIEYYAEVGTKIEREQ